ncbi:MAG: hypothetical protein E2585_22780 [Comamonas sp.]|nr:hypothetical protein [Comamonas sp.]TYK69500.1 hypothetical protein FSY59_19395 [Comamonas sp. Z3]TYK70509.1 hypothetical protein FSY59_13205 [Comamonas sp. Z3]
MPPAPRPRRWPVRSRRSSSAGGRWSSRSALLLIPDHPLSRFAASPSLAAREGDDALAAGRPLLGIPGLGRAPA